MVDVIFPIAFTIILFFRFLFLCFVMIVCWLIFTVIFLVFLVLVCISRDSSLSN